jgi:hypothetical protein
MNAPQVEEPSPRDRIKEIGEILAAGLMRVAAGKSTPTLPGETDKPVDCQEVSSGHAAYQEVENSQ